MTMKLQVPVRLMVATAVAVTGALVLSHRPVQGLSTDLVISQVYGAGGESGASFRNDFVVLFNRGGSTVSLAGKSLQYASASGADTFGSNPIVSLSGSLAAGRYLLVQLAGGSNGAALPAADLTGTINLDTESGKVVLANTTSGLACNGGLTPCGGAQIALMIDLVGYGYADYAEFAPTPAISLVESARRWNSGCSETDNNEADFEILSPPVPQNSSDTAVPCVTLGSPIRRP